MQRHGKLDISIEPVGLPVEVAAHSWAFELNEILVGATVTLSGLMDLEAETKLNLSGRFGQMNGDVVLPVRIRIDVALFQRLVTSPFVARKPMCSKCRII